MNTKIDESDYPLVNQPINHPAIKFIKTTIKNIFTSIDINDVLQDEFTKDFNQNIPNCIIETFGLEDYHKHKEQTLNKWIRENELDMLNDMKNLAKLGFEEDENLQYQETYGFWKDVRDFGSIDEETKNKSYNIEKSDLKEIDKQENKLQKVEELIEQYFKFYENVKEGYLRNILFLIADFGKGKTSFLHYLASKLAQNYLKTHEGLFPVYLNLNEYENFANSSALGVISNYLAIRYKIEIKDEYFKKKNYFFLIDSLDECGELTESKIDNVIKDIIDIQNLDYINQRENRIIIASRPIAKGLVEQIKNYKPFIIKHKSEDNKRTEEINNFISVYGFKKEQFDNYVEFALKKYLSENKIDINNFSGFSKKIISKIETEKPIGLYSDLYSKVLQQSELKRPIFAYMIYKLIISNSNFIDFGKVGVYISFLNQLSRDAKHKNEPNHKVSLKEEFEYRNILHASAILWQFKRQNGEQTSLTKADICRTIMEEEINKDDKKVLSEFDEIESIHFLSHSYLGEKENTLHFQHQSFAEILLAEYYLKVFINYAFDENAKTEDARIKLSLGIPTDQTIEFFKGLLVLLKECAENNPNDKTIFAKRELLIPLLASIATRKNNTKLYSTILKITWFKKYEDEIYSNNKLNDDIINDFPIDKNIIGKIELLCQKIIESQKTYLIEEPKIDTILFKKELMSVNKLKGNFNEIDKWLALIAGNKLSTDIEKRQFFNSKLEATLLFNLIQNWNYNFGAVPSWGFENFMGIDMSGNNQIIELQHLNLYNCNFSYSYLKRLEISISQLMNCIFSNCLFEYFHLIYCYLIGTQFNNIQIEVKSEEELKTNRYIIGGKFSIDFCFIDHGVLFPSKLNDILKGIKDVFSNYGVDFSIIQEPYFDNSFYDFFSPIKGLFKYILQQGKRCLFHFISF